MSAEPLTANLAGGPLTSPRGAAAPNVGGQVQVAARLRVRKAAAYRRLIRGLLLLLLNVAAVVLQCVCLDVSVLRDGQGFLTEYNFDELTDFAWVQIGLTVASWLILANYYSHKWHDYLRLELLPRTPGGAAPGARMPHFFRSHMVPHFVAEAAVLAVQPVPWWHDVWAYEAMGLLMFVRLYLFARVVRDWAQVFAQKECLHEDGAAKQVPFSCRLAFKVLYSQKPVPLLVCIFAVSYSALVFAFHVAERDEQKDFEQYNHCAWFIIVTMTTVGYGDFYPVGNLGRVIASLACVYGIIFLALVVTCITDNLGLNGGEASIINVVREDTLRRHQSRAAAAFIQDIWLERRRPPEPAGQPPAGGVGAPPPPPTPRRRLQLLHEIAKHRKQRTLLDMEDTERAEVFARLDGLEELVSTRLQRVEEQQAAILQRLDGLSRGSTPLATE